MGRSRSAGGSAPGQREAGGMHRSHRRKAVGLLVDTSELKSFPPETQRLIVEQQKWVLSQGMRRSAVVTPGAVVNTALDMTRRQSGHTEEYKFSTREEALAFLKGE